MESPVIVADWPEAMVVTANYVGPDRRKDDGRDSNVELFDPPNSLKLKTLERLSPEEITARLDAELRDHLATAASPGRSSCP